MTAHQWSPQQRHARDQVGQWLESQTEGKQVFRLFGLAGTGKTTIAKDLVRNVKGKVHFGAYTGKAAMQMRKNGMPARTVHSMTYTLRPPDKGYYDRLKQKLQRATTDKERKRIESEMRNAQRLVFDLDEDSELNGADLLVLDEVSFIDKYMGEDLLSFGCPILVLGDPGQLPPIEGQGFFTDVEPDVKLTEIHRQAQDDPIVSMAMEVRKGKQPKTGTYPYDGYNSEVIYSNQLTPEHVTEADQVLVGKHKTRRRFNQKIREQLGRTSRYPEPGERLVCLRNESQEGLLNGMICEVRKVGNDEGLWLRMDLETEEGTKLEKVKVHKCHFDAYYDPQANDLDFWTLKRANEFDFGYALTVHKAQGSQWDKVVFYDDLWGASDALLRRRWLYTGITRAAKQLTFVRPKPRG